MSIATPIKTVPVIFLADNGEAVGHVHWFCSEPCRDKYNADEFDSAYDMLNGESYLYDNETVCETCGVTL